MSKVSFDVIEEFLEGRDPQKHIVSIESNKEDNFVYLVVNDPETGKRIEKHKYKPFLWMKHDITKIIYNGNRRKITEEARKYDIRFKKLRTNSDDGSVPKRMDNGYKYLVQTRGSFSDLEKFFIRGGVNIRKEEYRPFFVILSLDEQFLIQTGKRLFKGMDDYNDVHKMQFDLETEGLDPMVNAIFQIGVRDNKGFELVMETRGETPSERRDSERKNIIDFFNIVNEKKPDILTAYNSENFDWPFFENRCLRLGLDLYKIVKTLNPNIPMKRKDATLKLGGEQESYKQTYIWGMNVLDISHSVRRAQAINSNIKRWSLKYITQFSRVAKKNRVYVDGDIIHKTWADTNDYWFNNDNGQWGLLSSSEFINERPENVQVVKGEYIVQRYLLDDLWETEQVDNIYNQAAYLIAKIIPTSYMRSSTMGTAGQWKLIMAAWSYENNLAIPELQKKRDFTGGLSRLLEVGYARNVVKADFAALYPKTELTWKIFPDLDISGVMEGLLTYVVDKRDEFKFLTGEHKDKAKELEALLEKNKHKLSDDRITKAKSMIEENKTLGSNYDKKQLPLKILANSFFGAYGAPYIFNWGDSDCAEETTCRGRQYLRLMVKFFKVKYNFKPLLLDTDGVNFIIPNNIDEVKYITQASHWKTKHYEVGQELTGLDAVLAEFNETYMIGRMGLDIDDICNATINFARKNYANDIDGKVKLVGNSIKSKAMPEYIEEFIDKGVRMLLDGKGYDFIEYYYEHVDRIYNYQIPALKMASKSRVKMNPKTYVDVHCNAKNKNGQMKSRQAHMELILKHELDVNLGDTIYYINVGTSKSHADIKNVKDKITKKPRIEFNCKLLPQHEIDTNPDYITTDYNVPKYLDAFNKRIKPLLVCFSPEIRDSIIIDVAKDKKTKLIKLQERSVFTESQCELTSGQPYNKEDQDTYEDLMTMEDKEIRFWDSVNKIPNNMEEDEWEAIRKDYHVRRELNMKNDIQLALKQFDDIIKRFELPFYEWFKYNLELPDELSSFLLFDDETEEFILKKWDTPIATLLDMFKYYDEAIERDEFYQTLDDDIEAEEKYNLWLNHLNPQESKEAEKID